MTAMVKRSHKIYVIMKRKYCTQYCWDSYQCSIKNEWLKGIKIFNGKRYKTKIYKRKFNQTEQDGVRYVCLSGSNKGVFENSFYFFHNFTLKCIRDVQLNQTNGEHSSLQITVRECINVPHPVLRCFPPSNEMKT